MNKFQAPEGSLYWEGHLGRFGWLLDIDKVHHVPQVRVMTSYWLVWGILFGPLGLCWYRASSLRVARLWARTQVPANPVMDRIFAEWRREARRNVRARFAAETALRDLAAAERRAISPTTSRK